MALANMLEKFGIDFVVLESFPDIAPQVGASIGLFPNGLRILDQLGCYEALMDKVDEPLSRGFLRSPDGKVLKEFDRIDEHLRKRHGYPVVFLDRQMVLQVMYDNLKDKSKVKVAKRVVKVSHLSSHVEVLTEDGESFTGDILLGADGIHSTVRKEMWRLAAKMAPGYIPVSEYNAMPCDYKCIFGISIMESFVKNSVNDVLNEGFSYLIIKGPAGRVYWFLFVNNGKTQYGDSIARYTKADEEQLAKKHSNDRISEDLTFGDLYESRISSVLTALPEYVFKKWYFKRIFTLGDASHKFEPISGQGGMSALETAAALVNALARRIKQSPAGLSDLEIEAAFAETQQLRTPRVEGLVKRAHEQQILEAMETFKLKFTAMYLIPRSTIEERTKLWGDIIVDAVCLDLVPVPSRPRFIPYDDELPAKPLSRTAFPKMMVAVSLAAMYYVSTQILQLPLPELERFIVRDNINRIYVGIPAIDSLLCSIVAAFSIPLRQGDPHKWLQCFYFMINLTPAILVWTVEAYRPGNKRSLLSWPSIFFASFQLLGIGKIAPLYYLISVYTTSRPGYARTSGRPIPVWVAKALLPAICLGYIVPTIIMHLPLESDAYKQNLIAFWQPSPIYVSALTAALSYAFWNIGGRKDASFEIYKQEDVIPLQVNYGIAFALSAVTHVCTMLFILLSSSVSLSETFLNLLGPGASAELDLSQAVFIFFKHDMILYFACLSLWSLYSVFELRRLGYVSSNDAVKAALVVAAGQVLVGPAATYVGLWSWRESVISRLAR